MNQKLKADNDAVGLEMAYQKIIRVLRETKKLDQVRSLWGPEYVWRMTATLSQLELGLWKGFKRQQANHYETEFDCFLDFSQDRLEYWSDLADESRAMSVQQSAAPAAKPAGGHGGDSHKGRKDGRDNRRPWNQSGSSNNANVATGITKVAKSPFTLHSHLLRKVVT